MEEPERERRGPYMRHERRDDLYDHQNNQKPPKPTLKM